MINDLSHIVSICAFSSRNNIEDVACFYKEAKALFNHANVLQNTWYVDVLPQHISKASAIKFILNLVEGDKQLMAIGDSYNDVPMFEIASRSFTFNHSPDEVKEKSNDLVDHLYQAIALIL